MTNEELQFHLEQFKILRNEIRSRSEQQIITERNVILACSAIYVALATIPEHTIDENLEKSLWAMWWLPPVLSLFGFIRWLNGHMLIMRIAEYIRGYEKKLCQDYQGWETFLDDRRNEIKKYNIFVYKDWYATFIIWLLWFVSTLFLSISYGRMNYIDKIEFCLPCSYGIFE